jgi:hypothetical protein
MERALKDILLGNRAHKADTLPLVHTAPAYFIQKIIQSGAIHPKPCDVYSGESLSYFFVGRPAYKSVGRDVMHWELPSCVIVDFEAINPKRIYPFDSGAFKKGFLPKYASMMDIEDFNMTDVPEATSRYIGTFFGSSMNYFMQEPQPKETLLKRHGILPTEGSLHALISLISGERIKNNLDERRSAIEYQSDESIYLKDGSIKAVILPMQYLEDRKFIKSIESQSIQVITYRQFPINSDFFYNSLYEKCLAFYNL